LILEVTSEATGAPLAPLHVRITQGTRRATVTLEAPSPELRLAPGRVQLTIRAPGHAKRELVAQLGPGPNRVPVRLAPVPSGTLEGVVRLDAPAPFVLHLDGVPHPVDDPSGAFRLEGVPAGRKVLRILLEGATATAGGAEVMLDAGQVAWVEVDLRALVDLHGAVFDPQGFPLSGAQISLGRFLGVTSSDGAFSLSGLTRGDHTIRVLSAAYDPLEAELVADGLEGAPRAVHVPQPEGTLTLAGAAPGAARALVTLSRAGTDGVWRVATTDEDARFAFPNLTPGSYRVSVDGRALEVELNAHDVRDALLTPPQE
jgi:hypothetical protein